MKSLPEGVSPYTRSPEFSEDTIPKNLRQSHRTKAGAWGKIVVLEGRLLYRILEPERLCCKPDEGARWSGRVTCSP